MNFFQTIYKNFAAMGFNPNQQKNNHFQFHPRQIFYIIHYSINIILCGVFLFCEEHNTEEYMESIYGLTAVTGITIAFISIILKNDELFINMELAAEEGNFSRF